MPGRKPREDSIDWEGLADLAPGTCVVIRTTGHRVVVGRIVKVNYVGVLLHTRRFSIYRRANTTSPYEWWFRRKNFHHARVVEGFWSHHLDRVDGLAQRGVDFEVVRVGVPEAEWRGYLEAQHGRRVRVRNAQGDIEWYQEWEIETAEERHRPPPSKPGRRHNEPWVDDLNDENFRRRRDEEAW